MKKRGDKGQKRIKALSFAKILLNLLFYVPSVTITGPLSKYLSLKPRFPPPQAQALPHSSRAKLLVKPHAISENLGNNVLSLAYFI